MIITKTSIITGETHDRTIDVTEEAISAWKLSGKNIQDAFPHLSSDDREFLMTGITPREWKGMFEEAPEDPASTHPLNRFLGNSVEDFELTDLTELGQEYRDLYDPERDYG